MGFSAFRFNSHLQSVLVAQEFTQPTPIQAGAIPPIMEGRDVMGLAQTGTGKTAAFVLPILQRLAAPKGSNPRALIIAPTRELAQQINDVVRAFGDGLGLRSVVIVGGAPMGRQLDRLRRGVDLIVACPGRLLDHVDRRTVNLSALECLVLDEADQMFDMGFLPAIREIIQVLPRARQNLMFSATMPGHIRRLAAEILTNPVDVKVDSGAPAVTVSHAIFPVRADLKTQLLLKILEHTDTESVLIFVRTKHRAKKVADQLQRSGFSVTSLQGNLSQGRRQEAMRGFRSGAYRIMVATDIAARGIDISTVSHVINYDIPDTTDAYTHRIGRTGRAAKHGDAFTIVTQEDVGMVRAIERVLRASIERRQLKDFDYNQARPAADPRDRRDRHPARQSQNRSGSNQGRRPDRRSSGRGPGNSNGRGPGQGSGRGPGQGSGRGPGQGGSGRFRSDSSRRTEQPRSW